MRIFAGVVASLLFATAAIAAPKFPTLTGRVVDNAHLLSEQTKQTLTSELAQYEAQSGHQLVVVTVPTLGGMPIEQYGYQLGRAWGIGQKGKNDGVILLVAPMERKVRIEVGYGLEGTLTDAASSAIVQATILPAFKRGAMEQGIVDGVHATETVLSGGAVSAPAQVSGDHETHLSGGWALLVVLIVLFLFSQLLLFVFFTVGSILGWVLGLFGFGAISRYMARKRGHIYPADKALLLWLLTPSTRVTGSGGGSFGGGGGFSGGGGSFGGGGSSGSW